MEVVEHYKPYQKFFNFTVIDDGSQDEPLTPKNLPKDWKGYRIEQDLGWGNEVCRNILMRNTQHEWNALLDLDIVIDLDDKKCREALIWDKKEANFHRFYGMLYELPVTWQFFSGARTKYDSLEENPDIKQQCLNSFIISRTAFLKTYGYDMTLAWLYGNDFTLPAQMVYECLASDTKLKKLAIQASPGDSRFEPGDQSAYNEIFEKLAFFQSQGYLDSNNVWRDPLQYQKHCVNLPKVVDLS